jgi:hypothetical protein
MKLYNKKTILFLSGITLSMFLFLCYYSMRQFTDQYWVNKIVSVMKSQERQKSLLTWVDANFPGNMITCEDFTTPDSNGSNGIIGERLSKSQFIDWSSFGLFPPLELHGEPVGSEIRMWRTPNKNDYGAVYFGDKRMGILVSLSEEFDDIIKNVDSNSIKFHNDRIYVIWAPTVLVQSLEKESKHGEEPKG